MAAADGALVERALARQRRRQFDARGSFRPLPAHGRMLPLEPSPRQFADRKPAPLAGDDFGIIGEQRRRHGGGMRRHAGAEIEGDAVEMIA